MRARSLDSAPMAPRPQLRLLTAIFGALLAIALGACGSSGPENGLSQEQADKLVGALENLQGDVDSGDCDGAEEKLTSIRGDVDAIAAEGNVDKEIIDGLGEMIDQTDTLLADCTDAEETEETTSSSTTTSTESEPTTTESEETKPEETKPEPEPEPEEPPEEEEPEPTEPPSDNGPPGPEGNPNEEPGFEDTGGGLSPGQERKGDGKKPAKDEPAKPDGDEKRMMGATAPPAAGQESGTR
jgi:hypothetical protein